MSGGKEVTGSAPWAWLPRPRLFKPRIFAIVEMMAAKGLCIEFKITYHAYACKCRKQKNLPNTRQDRFFLKQENKNYFSPACCFSARGMVTVATGAEGLVKMV